MAQPMIPDWNPDFGVDPKELELCPVTYQLAQTNSSNEVPSHDIGQDLHHGPLYLPGVDALHANFPQAALARPDFETHDQEVSLLGHAHNAQQHLHTPRYPQLSGATFDVNNAPGIQSPAAYAETEHRLSQANHGVPSSTVQWLDSSMQSSQDNGCAPLGPDVPGHLFMGMDSTSRGWELGFMASSLSTANGSPTQPAGMNTLVLPQKSIPKKRTSKTVTFRHHKARSRRSPQHSLHKGPVLGKGVRLGVSSLDSRKASQDEDVDGSSVETAAMDPHHIKQQQALALLKNSFRPSSAFSAQKFADLMVQIEQLVIDNQKYIDPTIHSMGTSLTSTVSSTIDTYSNSGVVDLGYPTDDTSVSSAPYPQVDDAQDSSTSKGLVQRKHRHCSKCGIKPLFYCTRKNCGYSTHIFTDWKRHEEGEKHWPQERFMCLECPGVPPPTDMDGRPLCEFCHHQFGFGEIARAHYLRCPSARQDGTTFSRKDHLIQHLREEHGLTYTNLHISTWRYPIESKWPRQCGFCETQFTTWDQRMRHIAKHFEEGKDMSDWMWPPARPKDFRPQGPHSQPKDDDSDNGDDSDDSNGGLGRDTAARKRTATSSVPPAEGEAPHEGNQSYTSHTCGHSDQAHLTDNSVQTKQHDVAELSSLSKSSVALEMYLNDPYEPIGARLNLFRSRNSNNHPSGASLDSTCEYNEDCPRGLREQLEGLPWGKRADELHHSLPRISSVSEQAPYRDLSSATIGKTEIGPGHIHRLGGTAKDSFAAKDILPYSGQPNPVSNSAISPRDFSSLGCIVLQLVGWLLTSPDIFKDIFTGGLDAQDKNSGHRLFMSKSPDEWKKFLDIHEWLADHAIRTYRRRSSRRKQIQNDTALRLSHDWLRSRHARPSSTTGPKLLSLPPLEKVFECHRKILKNHFKPSHDIESFPIPLHLDVVHFLTKSAAEIERIDICGKRALHLTAQAGDREAVILYLHDKGANIELQQSVHGIVLQEAVRIGRLSVFDKLLRDLASLNAWGSVYYFRSNTELCGKTGLSGRLVTAGFLRGVFASRLLSTPLVGAGLLKDNGLKDHSSANERSVPRTSHAKPLELVSTALAYLHLLAGTPTTSSDSSYAAMDLLRRLDMSPGNEDSQPFARLALVNDSDASLKRIDNAITYMVEHNFPIDANTQPIKFDLSTKGHMGISRELADLEHPSEDMHFEGLRQDSRIGIRKSGMASQKHEAKLRVVKRSCHGQGSLSRAEDAYLRQLVCTQGSLNWVRIAVLMGSRSPKQCRERSYQNIKSILKHESISPGEGLTIERMVGDMGKRWGYITRMRQGRSGSAVKNWWDGSVNHRQGLILRRTSTEHDNMFDDRTQSIFPWPTANRQHVDEHRSPEDFSIDGTVSVLTHQEKDSGQRCYKNPIIISFALEQQDGAMHKALCDEWRACKFTAINMDWQQSETALSLRWT